MLTHAQVKFPGEESKYKLTWEDVVGRAELPEALRNLSKLCSLRIDLLDGGEFTVEGFGAPFANPGHPSEDWIYKNRPIVGDLDLLSLLRRRSLLFLIPQEQRKLAVGKQLTKMPFRFPVDYPFGETESFDIDSFETTIRQNMVCTRPVLRLKITTLTSSMQGKLFTPYYTFDDDQQSVCSNAMSQVEDIFWTNKASSEILEAEVPAYFVPGSDGPSTDPRRHIFYAVIRLTNVFREQFKSQWARLTKDEVVELQLHCPNGPKLAGKIMGRPDTIPVLEGKHVLDKQFVDDLVVRVYVPDIHLDALKGFEGRVEAEVAKVRFFDQRYMACTNNTTRTTRSFRTASRSISRSISLTSSASSKRPSLSSRTHSLCRRWKTAKMPRQTYLFGWAFTETSCAARAFTAA